MTGYKSTAIKPHSPDALRSDVSFSQELMDIPVETYACVHENQCNHSMQDISIYGVHILIYKQTGTITVILS
jgi:hypothetical protein